MNDKKEKFNVGDIVITLSNLKLWDNVYHFQKFINELKNAKAITHIEKGLNRGGYFTTDKNIDLSSYSSREEYQNQSKIFHLDNGKSIDLYHQCFNYTQNKAGIKKYLQEKFNFALKKCDEADKEEIDKLEKQIAVLQAKIEKVKRGERSVSFDSRINEREFINERIDEINHVLNGIEK